MLSFFKKIMKQKSGESVCVQLLQTLNILFENISHETSLCEQFFQLPIHFSHVAVHSSLSFFVSLPILPIFCHSVGDVCKY